MIKTRLKGGSLSGTYLCTPSDGTPFVRKEVSLTQNREYGFQRWYSQLKRMQRYEVLFPGHFPKILTYGKDAELAYFDMEYIAESVTVQQYLLETESTQAIDKMFEALFDLVGVMYRTEIPSTAAPFALYIYEEIEQKMLACRPNARFVELASHPTVYFNGEKVPGLSSVLPAFKRRRFHTETSRWRTSCTSRQRAGSS
jgi:hypothetical protein